MHDNEALVEALNYADEVIPLYVFDERLFKNSTRYGFKKTGVFRAKFIIDCVHDLKLRLEEKGSNLIVRTGEPEEVIFDLAKELKTSWIFCNRERTQEEVDVQDSLEQKLWSIGQEIRFSRGKMLYHTADLPFPITHVPDVFSQFRKEVEKFVSIREPLAEPDEIDIYTLKIEEEQVPTLQHLDYSDEQIVLAEKSIFSGGEVTGRQRLQHYFWESQAVASYYETRNDMLGMDYSSKFSPWLAQGCLSPKYIYKELKRFELEYGDNKSTYWIFFELLWRDFFRFMGKKHGNHIFQKGGTKQDLNAGGADDLSLLTQWADGLTGVDIVDANMIELKNTGFMSNRGRQITASYLINDLKVNWQMGAEYFESLLIDYDPCSNWGNWNYLAGVGSDPKENRYFNPITQAQKYDPKGKFVNHWLSGRNNTLKNSLV